MLAMDSAQTHVIMLWKITRSIRNRSVTAPCMDFDPRKRSRTKFPLEIGVRYNTTNQAMVNPVAMTTIIMVLMSVCGRSWAGNSTCCVAMVGSCS